MFDFISRFLTLDERGENKKFPPIIGWNATVFLAFFRGSTRIPGLQRICHPWKT